MSKRVELESRLEEQLARLEQRVARLEERVARLEQRASVSRSDWSPVAEVKGDA